MSNLVDLLRKLVYSNVSQTGVWGGAPRRRWLWRSGAKGKAKVIVNYCCTRVLLYVKMQKETENEETRIFVNFF